MRPDGSHTAHLPFEDQVHQALENVLTALRSAGATADDVLKITAYIVDVERWPRFNALYAEMMGNARPARTVVPVAQLHYGYLVEVDAIAVCSGDRPNQDRPAMIDEDTRNSFYIGGRWVRPAHADAVPVINPATEESVAQIAVGSAADVDSAVAAARGAFPRLCGLIEWRHAPPSWTGYTR